LSRKGSSFFLDRNEAREEMTSRIRSFRIVGEPETRVEFLSGGNQQRALLSFLPDRLTLLLMEHPTRGLDIESTRSVWTLLLKRREEGTAILFSSADLDEIVERSDRILVFSGGRMSTIRRAEETSAQQLGEMIGGRGL
jgi:simple sugar transport system ATP-binding protein